jgi:predicted phage tail protein
MTDTIVRGSKGSESSHTPVESPDSLINTSYANILDAISEGPIVGLVNGARSIYLDETPIQGTDGSMNFTGVTWEQRFGEHDQDYITGFPSVETEHAVGVELKASQPWTQSLSNLQLSGARLRLGASALYQQNSDGDTTGFTVNYVVELSTDGSDYVPIITTAFNGKTTTGYQRSHRIDLPAAEEGWSIRVRRTTPDYTDAKIGDTTTVVSYTEVIDAKLQYPYTALVGIKIDASQFSNIPERAFRIKGRIIQVPSNYTPESRTYSGTWDGTFKLAWTDNPAWIYRDIIINDRYGLGRFISSDNVDKWELYQIAQYCDAMVSDGKGGQEPRFTCNLYLQSRADALQVLQDLASIFRGMAYYAGSEVVASADMPNDPVYTYTNANVIEGYFSRPGSSGSTRFSVAKVSWTDRDDFGAQKVEYVPNTKAIARYGIRETEITAFGCVSQGQAQRLGHYTLLTNQLETGTIQFSVGLDGVLARPGQIIRVADQHYAGKPIGGRVKASTTNSVTVDDDLTVAAGGTLVVIQPNGTAQTRVIKTVAGRVITVTENFSAAPVTESVYAIETAEVVPETYRILTITENFGDDKLQYDVVAVQHNASKFAAIDSGAQIVTPPTTTLPGAVQAMPTNIQLSTYEAVKQGLTIATMRITWEPARSAQSYQVWWKKDSGDWVYAGITYTSSIEVSGIYSGTYTARVSAVGVNGNSSLWAYSEPTLLNGKEGLPPAITSLTTESLIFGIGLKWTFPPDAEDTQRTELWYSQAPDLATAIKLADLAYPQSDYTMQGLRAGQSFFFWARLVDRTGNLGPWFPQAPTVVNGQASADADDILDYLTGEITESQLGQELLGEIGKIGGDGPGSVNERLDQVKTDLGDQITDVNNTVTEVQTELQAQIDQIADLADSMPYKPDDTYTTGQSTLGEDGFLYQATQNVPKNTPPPNTAYWLNVGQAVQTANGLAARVTTAETKITNIEGVTTAQANQITGLQTSLTTTNGNVTAAQNAANAANTLAGGKGKVMVQSATPAAADQLAQNLWIDTTNNANTPKRWTGSAWQAVTDKAATDAATAAANALALAQTKADASAVQSLTTRVTAAEGSISSQGTAITGLNNSLTTTNQNVTAAQNAANAANTLAGGKGKVIVQSAAPAAADQLAQNLWIDITNNANTPKRWTGSKWDAVTDKAATDAAAAAASALAQVATKAEASTVQALQNTVTQQGTDLTAAGSAIIAINANIATAGAQNLLYNPSFDRDAVNGFPDGWGGNTAGGAARTYSKVPSTIDPSGTALRYDMTGLTSSAANYCGLYLIAAKQPAFSPSQSAAGSVYVKATAGLRLSLALEFWDAGTVDLLLRTAFVTIVATGDWQRITCISPSPAGTASAQMLMRFQGTAALASGFVEVDRAQLQNSTVVTGWQDNGQLSALDIAAQAAATTALTARVTQTETGLTSVSGQITQLTNSIGGNGTNLIPAEYSSFTKNVPVMAKAAQLTLTAEADAAAYTGYLLRASNNPSSTGYLYLGSTITDYNLRLDPSGKYIASFWAKGSVAHPVAVRLKYLNSAGASAELEVGVVNVTTTLIRYSVAFTVPAAVVGRSVLLLFTQNVAAVGDTWFDGFMMEGQVGASTSPSAYVPGSSSRQAAATSEAIDALSSTVTQQGTTLTSVGTRTTTLENAVNSTTSGLATKASASSVDTLTNRVTAAEGNITSTSGAVTQLQNSINAIGGSGSNILPVEFTTFGATLPAMASGSGAVLSAVALATSTGGYLLKAGVASSATGYLYLGTSTTDYNLRLKTNGKYILSFWAYGSVAHSVGLRLKYVTAAGGTTEVEVGQQAITTTLTRYSVAFTAPAALVDRCVIVIFPNRTAAVADTFFDGFMLETQIGNATAASDFVPGQAARQLSAQSTALSSLSSTVTQIGNTQTAQAQSLTQLQSTVGGHTSQISQLATTTADSAGKIAATYSLKLALAQNGLQYVAGFGVSLDNSSGVVQSQFVVAADRFAVIRDVAGNVTSPFIIENGQIFMSDAVIKQATIANAVVGQYLRSAAKSTNGQDIMTLDMVAGQVLTRNNSGTNYCQMNNEGIFGVSNGVVLFELRM